VFKNLFLLLFIVLIAGCQSIPESLEKDAGPLFRRGIVSDSEQGIMFKPCYVAKKELINDHTGKLLKRLNKQIEPTVYVELSGDNIAPGRPWDIYKVHLIGGNESTCGYELSGNDFRAAGNSPVWITDLRTDGIHVQNYGRLARLIFPLRDPINLGNGREWNTELKGIEAYKLTLKILEIPCRDRYGIEYEYSSEMTLNGKVFSGCAREGNLDLRTLPGLYSAELPGVRSAGRFITLDITREGDVILTQDYRNNQPLIVQKGSWERLSTGRIVIHLTEIDGRKESEILIFERDRRGGMLLKGYSSTYGQSGLRLERVGPERIYRKVSR
jgi:uncharacterized membrane protein